MSTTRKLSTNRRFVAPLDLAGIMTSHGLGPVGRPRLVGAYLVKQHWPPFDDDDLRRELRDRLQRLPGVAIPDERLTKRPNIPLDDIVGHVDELLETIAWVFDRARAARDGAGTR